MDDESIDIEHPVAPARKHDGWSLVVLSLNYATQVACQTANFIGILTDTAAQHHNHKIEQDKFYEIAAKWEAR